MTARWRFAIVCGPRRWDGGTCRAASQHRSRGLQCEASPGRWTDHPSAGAGVHIAAKLASESPARLVGWPAKRRAAVGGSRAGRSSRPTTGYRSRPKGADGRKPGCPAPPSRHPERQAAAGLDVSVRPSVTIRSPGTFSDMIRPGVQCRSCNRERPLTDAIRTLTDQMSPRTHQASCACSETIAQEGFAFERRAYGTRVSSWIACRTAG
jgi:hypothetical protein